MARSKRDEKFAELLGDAFKDAAKSTGLYVLAVMLFIIFCWICSYS